LIHAIPAFTPSRPAKLLKFIPDKFLVFAAGDCMDARIRATHLSKDGYIRAMPGADCRGAVAGMRIKYGFEQSIYHLRSAVNNRVAFANNIPVICPSDQLKLS